MSFKHRDRVLGPDNREKHIAAIEEIIDYCEREGISERQASIAILEYCQTRGITLQQIEKDEPYR